VAAASYSETLDAGFIAEGWWVGTSEIEMALTDLSKGRRVNFTVPLVAEKTESNTWGYRSASSASKKAWKSTEAQFMRVFDDIVTRIVSDR
jgi:hypothetical protein